MKLPMLQRRLKLSGHICTVNLSAVTPRHDRPRDENNLGWLRSHSEAFEREIKEEVNAILGPNFRVEQVQYRIGSVEVSVVIATVGIVYYAVSRYKSFVESLDLMAFQLRKLIGRYTGPLDTYVTSGWVAGPALARLPAEVESEDLGPGILLILIWYLALSNAALLGFLFWLLAGS